MKIFSRLLAVLCVLASVAAAHVPQSELSITNIVPVAAAQAASTSAVTTCTPGSTVPSVTICSPTSTSGSPIHVSAAAKSSASVNYMAVWLDGSKVYQVSASAVDTTIPAAEGTHRVTVQAKDVNGALFSNTIYTTISASACAAGNTVPSVTICSPSSSSSAPIHVSAAARSNTAVNYMAVWMDGVKMYQASASSVDTSIAASTGTHRITVQAKDINGVLFSNAVYTTVGGTTNTWAISGTISPALSGAGAKLTLSGAKSATTTADASGNFTFTGLPNGSYTVTPTATGVTFTPASKNITVNGANITGANFSVNSTPSGGHSVSLSWQASTSATVSGYRVYRSTVSGGPYTLLNSAPVTSTVYTDFTVASGKTYYYVVTAVESSGTESSYSNQATAVVPTP